MARQLAWRHSMSKLDDNYVQSRLTALQSEIFTLTARLQRLEELASQQPSRSVGDGVQAGSPASR